jgi:hypothetical protein
MTILTLLAESALRSLALGAAVWMGLKAARVRNAQARMTAWTIVLIAAVLMPALMRWPTVPIPAPRTPLVRLLPAAPKLAFVMEPVRAALPRASIDWQGVFWGSCYLAGTILLLLRVLIGLALTWRLRRKAGPVPAEWDISGDVRQSEAIAAPATFGSTILLPSECTGWTPAMRQAVLDHERSHVEHRDFYIQLLASVYRAVFWFNPWAWWLRKQLAELAETRSDDAAIANFPDRTSYAEILVGFAKKVQSMPLAVAMARPSTVTRRVDRILAGTPLSPVLNGRTKALLTASLLPLIGLAAGCSIRARAQGPVQTSAQPPAPATVAVAKQLFQEQDQLGHEQRELEILQKALAERQAQASATPPDLSSEVDSMGLQVQMLRDKLKSSVDQSLLQGDFGDLQAQMAYLQAMFGDMQSRMREEQARFGEAQAAFAEQQAELAARQAILAAQQARAAEEAAALRKGWLGPRNNSSR